jgi:hypothetical protein
VSNKQAAAKTPNQLYRQIQVIIAGHRIDTVMAAEIASLAATIGFAADDLGQAEQLVTIVAADILRSVHENWSELQRMRLSAGLEGRANA